MGTIDEQVSAALAAVDAAGRAVWEAAGSPGEVSTVDAVGRICAYFRGDGYGFGTVSLGSEGEYVARIHRKAPDSGMSLNVRTRDVAELRAALAEHIAKVGGAA